MNIKESLKSFNTTDSLNFQLKDMTNEFEGTGMDATTDGLVTTYYKFLI